MPSLLPQPDGQWGCLLNRTRPTRGAAAACNIPQHWRLLSIISRTLSKVLLSAFLTWAMLILLGKWQDSIAGWVVFFRSHMAYISLQFWKHMHCGERHRRLLVVSLGTVKRAPSFLYSHPTTHHAGYMPGSDFSTITPICNGKPRKSWDLAGSLIIDWLPCVRLIQVPEEAGSRQWPWIMPCVLTWCFCIWFFIYPLNVFVIHFLQFTRDRCLVFCLGHCLGLSQPMMEDLGLSLNSSDSSFLSMCTVNGSEWWLQNLGPCYSHGKTGWGSWILVDTWPCVAVAGIRGVN